MNTTDHTRSSHPRSDACAYLLHLLLQRLEHTQPGMLSQMIAGVSADRSAAAVQGQPQDAVFGEALRMLQLANDQCARDGRLAEGNNGEPQHHGE